MTLQRRTFMGLLAGAFAGFLSWLVIDHSRLFIAIVRNAGGLTHDRHTEIMLACLGGTFGLLVSGMLRLVDHPLKQLSSPLEIRRMAACLLGGFLAGAIGLSIGQFVYAHMTASAAQITLQGMNGERLSGLIARCLGWTITGMFVGAAQSLAIGKLHGLRDGIIGGIIGGLAGGSVFEAFDVIAASPTMARLMGFAFLGAAIGFFTEAVPVLLRRAWLVAEGPGRRKSEWVIDAPVLIIGHSPVADIKLVGDSAVAAVHCRILSRGNSYAVLPAEIRAYKAWATENGDDVRSSTQAVTLNGNPISEQTPISGGELIGIGGYTLRLLIRHPRNAALVETPNKPSNGANPAVQRTKPVPVAVAPLTEAEVGTVASSRKLAGRGLSGTRLVGVQGPYYDQTFPLGSQTTVEIGREPDCDISLPSDTSVSRTHARITLDTGRHYISDLESAYGTAVNGVAVPVGDKKLLSIGDKIRVGDTVLRYE